MMLFFLLSPLLAQAAGYSWLAVAAGAAAWLLTRDWTVEPREDDDEDRFAW